MSFENARRKYQPHPVKYLLIAEAPPQAGSNRFFYFENVPTQDSLFIETMKVIYPSDCMSVSKMRSEKKHFLKRFMSDGFYLIDACETPMGSGASKIKQIELGLPSLMAKVSQFNAAKIILISATVFKCCYEKMRQAGLNVINDEMIDFPGSGGQVKFRNKMTDLLLKHGYNIETARL